MTRKIFMGAALFFVAAVALTFFAETTIKDPKPRPTLEWAFTLPDGRLDIKIESYRCRLAVAAAFEAFLLQASLALALMGAAGLLLRRIRRRSNATRPEPQPVPERQRGPLERWAVRRGW